DRRGAERRAADPDRLRDGEDGRGLEGLRRHHRRRFPRHDVPRHLQRPDRARRRRRPGEDAPGPQSQRRDGEGRLEVNTTVTGEVLALNGELSYETIPGVLAESVEYAARADLPDRLTIDFTGITGVDSSAVALLLEWRRQALKRGKTLVFANL